MINNVNRNEWCPIWSKREWLLMPMIILFFPLRPWVYERISLWKSHEGLKNLVDIWGKQYVMGEFWDSVKRIFLGKAFIFRFYWWMFIYKTGHPPLKFLPAFPFFLWLTGNKRNPQNVHSSCRNAACWKTLAGSIKVSCYLRNVEVAVHWSLYWYCKEKLSLGRSWEVKG